MLLVNVSFAGTFVNDIKEVSTWVGLDANVKIRIFKVYTVREFDGRLVLTFIESPKSEPAPINPDTALVLNEDDVAQLNLYLESFTTEKGDIIQPKITGKIIRNSAIDVRPKTIPGSTYVGSGLSENADKAIKLIHEIYSSGSRKKLSAVQAEKK